MQVLYDVLMSLFSDLPEWTDKISIFPLSMRMRVDLPKTIISLREHMTRHKLDPKSVISRSRKTVFVDIVHSGHTFMYLYDWYYEWAKELGIDPESLFLKMKIIAILKDNDTKTHKKCIENNIAESITHQWDGVQVKKFNEKALKYIYIDEKIWKEWGDEYEEFKLTESFGEWEMSFYYDCLNDNYEDFYYLPEDACISYKSHYNNTIVYAMFQQPKYRKMVMELMRKNHKHTPELKHESEDMAWHNNILSRINKKTPSKTHNNHSFNGQVNFKGNKNKRKLKDIENKVQKIVSKLHSIEDGYLTFKIQELPPDIRNRIVEHNMFILRKGDELVIYDSNKFELEDLKATYDNCFMGIFPHKNIVNPNYKSKKFQTIV